MRPICPAAYSVNQRLPSGPAAMSLRLRVGVMPAVNSVIAPAVVMRPIAAGV